MNHTFGGSLVDALHGQTNVVVCAGCCRSLDTSTKLALDSLVALGALGVSDDALFLALNVCHVIRG